MMHNVCKQTVSFTERPKYLPRNFFQRPDTLNEITAKLRSLLDCFSCFLDIGHVARINRKRGIGLTNETHPSAFLQRLIRFLRRLVLVDINLGAEVEELPRHLRHALLRDVGIERRLFVIG
jgi:hypothetical protein